MTDILCFRFGVKITFGTTEIEKTNRIFISQKVISKLKNRIVKEID